MRTRDLTLAAGAGGEAARGARARDGRAGVVAGAEGAGARVAEVEVILNAAAGSGDCEAARERLSEIFGETGLDARVRLARTGEELSALAARAAADPRCRVVVAGGGDGTLNAVAAHLVGTDKALGVLPLGTLNHFAKDLRLPLDLDEAARVVAASRATALVDVGEVNGRVFLNNSGLGLYPHIVRERERQRERLGRGKWAAFLRATLTVLRRYPFMGVRVNAEGRELRRRTPLLFVGNNEYELDAFQIGSRARLDGGVLCLHLTRGVGRLGLLRLALRALAGRLREDKDFDSLTCAEAWIDTRHARASVALDGEVTIMQTPLCYRVRPRALRVVVPEKSTED
jgi:diacylglycerol kinase family enzyme